MLTKEAISSIYDKLPSGAQKTIIKVFVDSEYTATATNIASETGVSQSYVSQVLANLSISLRRKWRHIIMRELTGYNISCI